ncbi:uncharacterized protein N7498_007883 [Penicillium cinerascens]|uniref:Uncharacterized protein n=1 Tax=Penicillium cinerascens TaxID=70096 RepID=A0A9W9JRU6_9EURO|nr:uncharacterized protein N7498_007883 [Penicillium cinerascens]KAJ5198766.1 hypothetical protein N7498_007883 [Penicillium cinerascens]
MEAPSRDLLITSSINPSKVLSRFAVRNLYNVTIFWKEDGQIQASLFHLSLVFLASGQTHGLQ